MQILANGFFRVLKGEECLVGVTAGKGRKEVVKNAVFYLGRFPLPGWLEFSTLIEPPLGEPHLSMMVLCLAQKYYSPSHLGVIQRNRNEVCRCLELEFSE